METFLSASSTDDATNSWTSPDRNNDLSAFLSAEYDRTSTSAGDSSENAILLDDDNNNSLTTSQRIDVTLSMEDMLGSERQLNGLTSLSSAVALLYNEDSQSSATSSTSATTPSILHTLESEQTWVQVTEKAWKESGSNQEISQVQHLVLQRAVLNKLGMTTLVAAAHHYHSAACYIFQSISFEHPYSWWHSPTQFEQSYLVKRRKIDGLREYLDVKRGNSKENVEAMITRFHNSISAILDEEFKNYSLNTTVLFAATSLCAQSWYDACLRKTCKNVPNSSNGSGDPHSLVQVWHDDLTGKFSRNLASSFVDRPKFGLLLFIIVLWLHYRRTFVYKNESERITLVLLFKTLCTRAAECMSDDTTQEDAQPCNTTNDFCSARQLLSLDATIAMLLIHAWRISCSVYRCYSASNALYASRDLLESVHCTKSAEHLSDTAQKCFHASSTHFRPTTPLELSLRINKWLDVLIVWVLNDMSVAMDGTTLNSESLPAFANLRSSLDTMPYTFIAEQAFSVMNTIFV